VLKKKSLRCGSKEDKAEEKAKIKFSCSAKETGYPAIFLIFGTKSAASGEPMPVGESQPFVAL
jgi:hypothetical protein